MKFILLTAILALTQAVFLPAMKNGNAFVEIQQVFLFSPLIYIINLDGHNPIWQETY